MTEFKHYSISDVVPQSRTMSLLDQIIEYSAEAIETSVMIRPDSLFAEQEGVPGWVGLEYMAQTIGAHAGVLARQRGEAPQVGFLVGARKYQSDLASFPLNTELRVHAQHSYQADNGLAVFTCEIKIADQTVAQAALNVFQPEDVEGFISAAQVGSFS